MKPVKRLTSSFKILLSRKLRTAVAAIGLIVGVSSVIIMSSFAEGARRQVLAKIRAMGTDLVVVTAGRIRIIAGRQKQTGNTVTLTPEDSKVLLEEGRYVKAAAPVQARRMLVRNGAISTMASVAGSTAMIFSIRNLVVREGRFFYEEEDRALRKIAVLGATVADNLFGDQNPVGENIRIGKVNFRIIGVLTEKGIDLAGGDQDDIIYIPLNTALKRLFNVTHVSNIYIRATGPEHIDEAASEVSNILRGRHRLRGKPDDFTIQSQKDFLKTEAETSLAFAGLLSVIADISLVLGGIGILAIMLISIKERRSEIGLRRAVGALKRDILLQFTAESLALGMSGGMIGIFSGIAVSLAGLHLMKWPLSLSFASVITAFLLSALIGMVSGVYPAVKAASLDPIAALKADQ